MKKLCVLLAAVMLISTLSTAYAVKAVPSDWAKESVTEAEGLNLTDSQKIYTYTIPITGQDFAALLERYCKTVGVESFALTDAERTAQTLTREEAAAILCRLVNTVHPDWVATCLYYAFEDESEISSFAMSPIQTICNMGIMKGVGNNRFAPKSAFTEEQAITTVLRVYRAFAPKETANTFADRLNALMPEDQNYLFSPLSVKMALMMAANGAEGATLQEILDVLQVADVAQYNASAKKLLESYAQSDLLKLEVANSLWLNTDKTSQRFATAFADTLATHYGAVASPVTNLNAASAVNQWVSDKTQGKIPTIVDEANADYWAMLVNAVYFKGRWQNEFYKGATEKAVFTSRDGSKTDLDFMHRRAWIPYADVNGVQTITLPYLTREDVFDATGNYVETKRLDLNISMYLMMSDAPFNPEEVLKNTELKGTYMNLAMPKFKVEYATALTDALKTLGIRKAFQDGAEFGKMFDAGSMFLSSAVHKTYISVDEEGTEAAAVTALGMAGSALPPEPIDVKFNKPFTFVIKDNNSGEILFMGEYAYGK